MNNENAFVCYAKNPVTFVASDALADIFYTNYEYFTDAAHLVTCTISCDFREITRMSATRFLFPIFRHLYLFSFRFYIYSIHCIVCSARGEEQKLGFARNHVQCYDLYTNRGVFPYESDSVVNSL